MSDALTDLFARCLDVTVNELSEESSPDNTPQWDSMAAVQLVTEIEATFAVQLRTRDIMKMRTIGLARTVLRDKGVAV
jgi:acyl carrier protein